MDFRLTASQYRFVQRRQDAAKNACCEKMRNAILGGSLGVKGTEVTLDVVLPLEMALDRPVIKACPFCGEEIHTFIE